MALTGRCACGTIKYTLKEKPLIVHACHCRDCQRITGTAFVINIWIERKFVDAGDAAPRSFTLVGGSGRPHEVFFCGDCGTYLWSVYGGASNNYLFVRAGTLDKPASVKPDVHIFTRSKVPWLALPTDVPTFRSFYKLEQVWSDVSLERIGRKRPRPIKKEAHAARPTRSM